MATSQAYLGRDFLAGATAGCTVRAFLFPIDTVKTNMQRSGLGLTATWRKLVGGTGLAGRWTWTRLIGVVQVLYRGLAPALLEVGVNRGALMEVSSGVKRRLPSHYPEAVRDVVAGCAAGALKTTILHPLDTLTCRGQVGRAQWELLWPPQPGALYNGVAPALIRSAGGMAIWLSLRNGLQRSSPEALHRKPWLRDWLVGMASTAVTDVCTFPLDTLKKNLQADGGSAIELSRRLVRDGGITRLYRGYSPRLVMVAVNGGLWNWVYVRAQEALGQ